MNIYQNLMKIYENLMKIYSGRMYQTSVRLLIHSTIDVPSGRMYQKWSNVSDFRQTSDTLHHRPSITTYFHIVQHILTDSQRFPFSVKIGFQLWSKTILKWSFRGVKISELKTCRSTRFISVYICLYLELKTCGSTVYICLYLSISHPGVVGCIRFLKMYGNLWNLMEI